MRTSIWLLGCAALSCAAACTGPHREGFPDDPTGGGASTSSTGTSTQSGPAGGGGTSSSSSTSTSSSDGGGGHGPAGPGGAGGDGGNPIGSTSSGGGGSGPAGPGGGGGATAEGGGGATAEGGGGSSSDGGGGSGPVCDLVGSTCVRPIPGGWTGPLALFEVAPAESLPSCNLTGWPTTLGDYFGDLDEGAALCDCQCEGAAGIVCTGNGSYCGHGNVAQCQAVCTTTPITPGVCLSAVSPLFLSVFAPAPNDAGDCDPIPTVQLPTPEWGVKSRACLGAATTPDGCGVDELCAPRPDAGEMCIVQSGDVACPGDGWTAKHLRYTSFTNTRQCSACSCGSATSTCGGQITFTDPGGSNCGANSFFVDEVNAGACSALEDAQYMQYSYAPSGTCPPAGGALSGTVTVDGTATYCCME